MNHGPDPTPDPLRDLPKVDRLEAARQARLKRRGGVCLARHALQPLTEPIGLEFELGPCERVDRPAGLGRAGMVAHLSWPRFGTRLGIGIETPLAHAAVDRLLGFWRFAGQDRLQITPVEWGLMGYVAARALGRLARTPGPAGEWDLILDRVSPEPFNPKGLGPVTTLRWLVHLGDASGSARLWIAQELLERLERADPPPPAVDFEAHRDRFGDLASDWAAEIGTVKLSRGLSSLRAGGVLPIAGCKLSGKPGSPSGRLDLTHRASGTITRLAASPLPKSGAGRLAVSPPPRPTPQPREPIVMSVPSTPAESAPATARPPELPVTLIVELGRISLTLSHLANLREGDIIELGRHPQEPVELTSGGRLVARGELVQIDTELGVRLTNVFV